MDYRAAIRIFLAEHADPKGPTGYTDKAARDHVSLGWPECGWLPPALDADVVEKQDRHYDPTYGDYGAVYHWIEAVSPGCRCGKFTDVLLRWDGSVTDALASLLGRTAGVLMAFGRPSWIAVALIGEDAAAQVRKVRSETATYGSTVGPFGGMGGAAMTEFTITELTLRGNLGVVYFADDRFLGWADGTAVLRAQEQFPRLDARDLNRNASTCPIPIG